MNPPIVQDEALAAKLTELLRQANINLQPPAPFGAPPMFAAPAIQPTGLLVAVTIPTAQGDVSGYLQLPPQALQNPAAVIGQLQAAGWPLRTYARRENGYGGYGGGWQGRRWGRRW